MRPLGKLNVEIGDMVRDHLSREYVFVRRRRYLFGLIPCGWVYYFKKL